MCAYKELYQSIGAQIPKSFTAFTLIQQRQAALEKSMADFKFQMQNIIREMQSIQNDIKKVGDEVQPSCPLSPIIATTTPTKTEMKSIDDQVNYALRECSTAFATPAELENAKQQTQCDTNVKISDCKNKMQKLLKDLNDHQKEVVSLRKQFKHFQKELKKSCSQQESGSTSSGSNQGSGDNEVKTSLRSENSAGLPFRKNSKIQDESSSSSSENDSKPKIHKVKHKRKKRIKKPIPKPVLYCNITKVKKKKEVSPPSSKAARLEAEIRLLQQKRRAILMKKK